MPDTAATSSASSLAELLRNQAAARGGRPLYTFLTDGRQATGAVSFEQLYAGASGVGAELERVAARGDRAIIFANESIEFMTAFLGCQLAGVVPVPAASPFAGASGLGALRATVRDCGATVVLTESASDRERLLAAAPEIRSLAWLTPAECDAPDGEPQAAREPHGIALLQYTSGSTARPKGVIVTQESMMHNLRMLQESGHSGPEDVLVSWLPLFHDMGLTAFALLSLYLGAHAVMMAPASFVMRPAHWLQAITDYRGTICGGPDFGYAHCVRRVSAEQRATLDLRSWEVAFLAAEPIRAATLDEFARAFASCGFEESAWWPAYGLAECTVMATAMIGRRRGATRLRVDDDALRAGRFQPGLGRTLVASGSVSPPEPEVLIVDAPTATRCPPDVVGEIWISGPDVCAGYWGASEATAETFGATLSGDRDARPFLRTGDLGFVHDGELYVTGRSKDLIIVAGANHHPHDIEETAASAHPAIADQGCVAFSIDRGTAEELVIAVALRASTSRRTAHDQAVIDAVRAAVARAQGIAVSEVVIVRRAAILRTTSGKLRRAACRDAFLRGELAARSDGSSTDAETRA